MRCTQLLFCLIRQELFKLKISRKSSVRKKFQDVQPHRRRKRRNRNSKESKENKNLTLRPFQMQYNF